MAETRKSHPNIFEQWPFSSVQAGYSPAWAKMELMSQEMKEITTLYNIAVAIGSSLDLKQVVRTIHKESGRLFDTANFAVVLYDEPNDLLDFTLVFDEGRQLKPFAVKYTDNPGFIARVVAEEGPLLIDDFVEADKMLHTDQLLAEKPVYAWLGVPIFNPVLVHEGTQGVIATWSYEPYKYTEHEVWLLSAIGTHAAIAIRHARLYESSKQRAEEMTRLTGITQQRIVEMELLNDITRTLSATLELEEVLWRIMERVEGMLKTEAGWLLLKESAGDGLNFRMGLGRTRAKEAFKPLKKLSLADEVFETGKPQLVVDVAQLPADFQELEQKLGFALQSIMAVPLILHDQIIGVLEVISKRDDAFTQNDLTLLNSIVPYAAIAIKNARFHESVLAERDRVIEAEEQARRALARDLHDGPTQLVSAMMMRLEFCKLLLDRDPAALGPELARAQELANQTIHQIRTLLFELRPLALEAQGLIAALRVFLDRRQKDVEGTIKISLKTKTINPDGEVTRQDDKVEGAVFAIIQEAVNNAIKHAYASTITIEVEETFTAIYGTIIDDGEGFKVEKVMDNYEQRGSLGMINIRERAELIGSELALESVPGEGTRISLRVPKAEEERLKKRRGTTPLTPPSTLRPEGSL